jgi:hypothetical protein
LFSTGPLVCQCPFLAPALEFLLALIWFSAASFCLFRLVLQCLCFSFGSAA